MFTVLERKPLHNPYFELVVEQGNYAVVMSRNTGDTWRVRVEDGWIITYHMPKGQKEYHRQCRSKTIDSAVKKIRKHDVFVMHGRYGKSRMTNRV